MTRVRTVLLVMALIAPIPLSASADDGRAHMLYLLHCGGCHLPNGRGVPPVVPSLAGDPGRLAGFPDGRRYLARVPGASQSPLSDAELTAVLNWVLSTFNRDTLPDGHTPLTVEEVAEARREVLADPLRERRKLWKRYAIQ